MNIATSAILACGVVLAGNCGAPANPGPAREGADTKSSVLLDSGGNGNPFPCPCGNGNGNPFPCPCGNGIGNPFPQGFCCLIASGVIGNTQRSVLGSLYPVKITFP